MRLLLYILISWFAPCKVSHTVNEAKDARDLDKMLL